MDAPVVIAGLGNPGREYERTRHNAGFMVLDRLAERWGAGWEESRRFKARVARVRRGGRAVWLCEPLTYMNLSGEAVAELMRYQRVDASGLLVVVDDADLPLGTLRMRPGGGTGGHHGLESVSLQVGTPGYARLRVGIGRLADGRREITGHVLGRFGADEAELVERLMGRAADQVECWVTEGMAAAMQRFNGTMLDAESDTETT